MALSNYLVKMSNTCRSPPKRITLLRKVVPLDNIAKTANKQQCYLPQAGISEFSRQLRTENDNRLCNSRLRGAGEVFLLLLSAKTSHRTAERERATTKEPSGICERCAVKSMACEPKSACRFCRPRQHRSLAFGKVKQCDER